MISTLIPRGLALGRLSRVGVDGSLTGCAFFSLFIAYLGLLWSRRKVLRLVHPLRMADAARTFRSIWHRGPHHSNSDFVLCGS